MLENCKRLICSPSLNKVYCIILYRLFFAIPKKPTTKDVQPLSETQLPPATRELQATVRTQILLTLSLQKREPTLRLLLCPFVVSNMLYDQHKSPIILMERKKG